MSKFSFSGSKFVKILVFQVKIRLKLGFSCKELSKKWVFRSKFLKSLGFQIKILSVQVKIRLKLGFSCKEWSKNWVFRSKCIQILGFQDKNCQKIGVSAQNWLESKISGPNFRFQVEMCRNSGFFQVKIRLKCYNQ